MLHSGNETFLPKAKDVYSVVNSPEEIVSINGRECRNIKDSFPQIRFSKISSPVQCRFSSVSGHIVCSVFVTRRQQEIQVDYCNYGHKNEMYNIEI